MHKQFFWVMAGALALTVSASRPASAATAPAVPGAPAGWVHEDIGGPGAAGDSKVTGTGPTAVWTITGSGNDIQNSADEFQFAYTTLTGDGGITARILSQKAGEPSWTKTGVMLRETNDAGSRMLTINFTSANGLEGGSRQDTDGGWSSPGANGVGRHDFTAGPIWLRVQHKKASFQILSSDDGQNWTLWGTTSLAMDLTKPILAGLCVTSHMDGDLASATFDNVSVSSELISPGSPLHAYPGSGAVLLAYGLFPGAVGYNIYRQGPTDKTPAKVNTDPVPFGWYIDSKGLTNGTSYKYAVKPVLKDAAGMVTEGPGSNVVLAEPQVPIAPGLYSYDIGTQTAGSTTLDNGTLTIAGSGADIQNHDDQFRFVAMPVGGDYSITAKILGKPAQGPGNTQTWIKAGVMIRESLDSGSRMCVAFLTQGQGIGMEYRLAFRNHDETVAGNTAYGGYAAVADGDVKDAPVWLKLTRTGENIDGFYSTDGTNFTIMDGSPAGKDVNFPRLSAVTYAGLAVTAHQETTLGIAKFDASSIKIQ